MKNQLSNKKYAPSAFTLTEVLIAVAIVGIIAGLVLPKLIENYQTKTMDSAFRREVQTIEDSINGLAVSENKADFFNTMMYKDTTPENYDDSSGAYMEKYLRTSKMCDNPKDCFAPTYYQYEAGKSRKEYKPDYKGACAILKNGMSICMIPQIGAANITGIIDLNGKKGPNVLDRDLRTFSIAAKTRVGLNQDTEGVRKLDWDNIKGEEDEPEPETPPAPPTPEDPCDVDKNSLECCKTRSITSSSDACCTYTSIYESNSACKVNYTWSLSCKNGDLDGTNKATCNFTVNPQNPDFSAQLDYYCSYLDFGEVVLADDYWETTGDMPGDQTIYNYKGYQYVLCYFKNPIVRYNGNTLYQKTEKDPYTHGSSSLNANGTHAGGPPP